MIDVPLPSLGPDMESGKLLQWHVQPGDVVRKGTVVATVDTEKAAIDVEVWQEGRVAHLLAEPGTRLAVGAPLLQLEGEAPAAAAVPASPETAMPLPAAAVAPAAAAPASPIASPGATPRASPAARQRAQQLGVELGAVAGTGPGSAITLGDVEAAAAAVAPSTAAAGDRRDSMRAAIAAAMSRSHREIPHYYLWQTCDITRASQWLQQQNAARAAESRLVLAALLVAAIARAAREFPDMNGTHERGAFHPAAEVHVGVAVALRGGGLIAPAIRSAHTLGVDAVMAQLSDLVRRARSGGLRSSEVSGQTITLTQLGDDGVQGLFGIIHPPQVALLGAGAPRDLPLAVDGQVLVRRCVDLSLAADHRVSDGRHGARFLARIVALLQQPEAL